MTSILCLFGHDWEYGSPRERDVYGDDCKCWLDWHRDAVRRVCRRCGKQGEKCLPKTGAWKVEFGRLVPDSKAWLGGEKPGLHTSQEPGKP